jgi:DNA-binding transcriptional MocR family regulator
VRGLGAQLRARRDLLAAAVREDLPAATVEHLPPGGLNLWVRLPDGTDVPRLVSDCERSGVAIAPGAEWFPAEPAGPFIRLNYAGPSPERFAEGVRVIGAALAGR